MTSFADGATSHRISWAIESPLLLAPLRRAPHPSEARTSSSVRVSWRRWELRREHGSPWCVQHHHLPLMVRARWQLQPSVPPQTTRARLLLQSSVASLSDSARKPPSPSSIFARWPWQMAGRSAQAGRVSACPSICAARSCCVVPSRGQEQRLSLTGGAGRASGARDHRR